MVELFMRKIAFFKEAMPPEKPNEWSLLTTVTASASWESPKDDWYRVHTIGRGGRSGGGGVATSSDGTAKSGGGGGGGSGGYCVSELYLKKGTTIEISITDSQSVFYGPNTMIATAGGNGTDGSSSAGGNPGAGGNASGGNLLNDSANGSPGGYADAREFIGNSNSGRVYSTNYGSGGAGGKAATLISTAYGNGASGGKGAYNYQQIGPTGGVAANYTKVAAQSGGSGRAGAVLIERGVYN